LGTPGSDLLQLNDCIYDLAITANRPDGMSVIGIAREISALLESTLNFPELKHKYNIHLLKGIKLCPEAIESNCIYTVSCIDGVNGEKLSPNWLKDRIEKSGIKSINLLVDLTNYILLEQGQPLHAFDKDKLSNLIGKEVSPEDFSVRKGKDNESLICLDGKEYDLNDNITVITCCDKPVAIAGVIGGLETSVSNTTSSIYLEGAVFNPVTIRKSTKAIGIRTESSSRYEKGISSKNTISAVTRAINLLEEYFSINSPIINTSNLISYEDIFIKLRRNRLHKLLGPLIINDQFEKLFWPILSAKLANIAPNHNIKNSLKNDEKNVQITEARLLSAISHEVRTPLATIRTLISSTLKKYKMDESMRNRLIQIDNECNEQIDRFGLIFNAAELVSNEESSLNNLAIINLAEIFKKLTPLWNKQLNRRGISLKIDIPNQLPQILSDSEKLELMLSGLIDKNTRGLKEGSTLILELRPAGQKLKLQLKKLEPVTLMKAI